MAGETQTKTCPKCERPIASYQFEKHVEKCDGTPAMVDVVDGCPMCGQQYDEYLTHLRHECSAGDRQEPEHAKVSGPR